MFEESLNLYTGCFIIFRKSKYRMRRRKLAKKPKHLLILHPEEGKFKLNWIAIRFFISDSKWTPFFRKHISTRRLKFWRRSSLLMEASVFSPPDPWWSWSSKRFCGYFFWKKMFWGNFRMKKTLLRLTVLVHALIFSRKSPRIELLEDGRWLHGQKAAQILASPLDFGLVVTWKEK